MARLIDITCSKCEYRAYDVWANAGEYPACPTCGAATERLWVSTASAHQDSIEGGVLIEHGICWPDGTPRRYYSKSEMAQEAKRQGVVNLVRHVPNPTSGSDKAKYTTRWI